MNNSQSMQLMITSESLAVLFHCLLGKELSKVNHELIIYQIARISSPFTIPLTATTIMVFIHLFFG